MIPLRRWNADAGFTLVELLITAAIVAVLLAAALPSMGALLRTNRLAAATNDMSVMLQFVRSEAIKRRHRVTACLSPGHVSCALTGGWHHGWIVFSDDNANGTREQGETILRIGTARNDGVAVTGNGPLATMVSFVASGMPQRVGGAMLMGAVTVCSEGEGRQLVMNYAGRVRIQQVRC